MEFTIEREVFLRAVQGTLGIMERRSALPILGNLLIAASGQGIRVSATDREISLSARYPASVIREGRFTVPARKIYEAVRELQGDTLHLDCSGEKQVVLTSNRVVCKLFGLPADDFPEVSGEDPFPLSVIPATVLREMIGKVCFAISDDDNRKTLQGVCIEKEKAGSRDNPQDLKTLARMVATDGHRLAQAVFDLSAREKENGADLSLPENGAIVPVKGIREIRKLMDGVEGDVSIGIDKGNCVLRSGDALLTVALIDGSFPDWRRVLVEPSDQDAVIRCQRDALLRGLRRMGVINSESVQLTIAPGPTLVLDAVSCDVGDIRDELETLLVQGGERVARFNCAYLVDAVDAANGDLVEIRLPFGRDMAVIKDADSDGYFCIVMGLKN